MEHLPTKVSNPDGTGINTNSIVSQFDKNEGTGSNVSFNLKTAITSLSNFSISLKAYIDLATSELQNPNTRIRIYLENSSVGGAVYKQRHFSVGQEWESITFDFEALEVPESVLNAGGFDVLRISFANSNKTVAAATYYLDSIYGSIDGTGHVAGWLSGSWGITFPIYGGKRLDSEVAGGYDYRAGAQQIVDELPAVGHIITNLSNFAKSYYFTLRGNENVDIATEIDEFLIPSLENEQIIFDVLQKFKDAGKKNILYISTNYFDRLEAQDPEAYNAWVTYYTDNFGGDEYLAYKDLVQGFVLRIKDYADGYWLDTTKELYDDGHIEDFVQMFRDADPGCAISASPQGAYFTDENGEFIKVDSDGLNDTDDRDYKIVSFEAVNNYQDFTSGHVTPLGQGAPPNSWAYEEFTLPAMVADPWDEFDGKKILKHAWFPMRDKWHVSSANLIFGTEDAYRFTRTLVDANAAITFATTIDDVGNGKGFLMAEEMAIMKTINDRLLSNPIPDYEPYVRPEVAYLVGETLSSGLFNKQEVKVYPNPVIDELTITRTSLETIHVKIISMMGVKVFETTWNDTLLSKQINITNFKSGVYFVSLSNGNDGATIKKIIINN